MITYIEIILKILPVIILFLIGFVLNKIHFFKENTVSDLKKIIVNLSLPCLLFIAFSQIKFEFNLLFIVLIVFLICLFMLIFGLLTSKLFKISSPYFALLFSGFETGMLGYAIFISMYGIKQIDKLAIVDLGQVLFVFFILVTILLRMKNESNKTKNNILLLFIKSPVIISIILGVIFGLFKTNFIQESNLYYETFTGILTIIGNLTLPLICISIGYEIKIDKSTLKLPIITILLRNFLLIIIALIINKIIFDKIFNFPVIYQYALITMFILPPPFVIAVYMDEKNLNNKQYVLNTLSLSTIISILIFIFVNIFYK